MRIIPAFIAGAALLVALPVIAKTDRAAEGEARLSKTLAGRVAGMPVSCINLREIRSTTIIDRTAIVYDLGGKLYVNRPGGASTLDDDDILVTKTHTSRLCDVDIVHLIDRSTHFPSGFVNLGKFVPYSKPAKPS
jgi:hypothetical protein